ncbi:MAG: DUF4864 domain-containing protein [Anaerolineae bacterium]|nr:DUF4864 domain-containing protein [Anaerolineae bacterium]
MKRRWVNFSQTGLVLVLLMFGLIASGCTLNAFGQAEEEQALNLPTPSPALSPEEVVRLQLESLQHNDEANKGIEAAFNFASPGNKRSTGPLTRFVKMLKAPPYNAMLNHKSVELDPIEISGDSATQRVKLIGADGQSTVYIFMLSKQSEAPYQDCWMTDGVVVEPTRDLPQDQA